MLIWYLRAGTLSLQEEALAHLAAKNYLIGFTLPLGRDDCINSEIRAVPVHMVDARRSASRAPD